MVFNITSTVNMSVTYYLHVFGIIYLLFGGMVAAIIPPDPPAGKILFLPCLMDNAASCHVIVTRSLANHGAQCSVSNVYPSAKITL